MDKVLYRHIKPCGETFYIGIGNKYRPYSNDYRNTFWQKITNKYPEYEVQILKSDLTWEDACELEKILISWYGRRDLNEGTLCNMTDGGEGSCNLKWSNESKLKFSKNYRGDIHHNFNKKFSKERCDNISKSLLGRKLSKEHIEKIKNSTAKKVINIETGEIYETAKEVSIIIGMTYSLFIKRLNGRIKNNTIYEYYKK